MLRYGEDDHYDVISAFIKSIRGSDPDAGLYWLARMLEAGEDARYIARRLVILASEDVGMADSMGLVVADAAARAVEFVGLPEAGLNLAHAVIYLATAPKSNTAMAGLSRAFGDVRRRQAGAVPLPLRSVHPYQRNKLGEGGGYRYPHNDPSGFVAQEYRPPDLAGEIGSPQRRVYYRPSPHGDEAEIGNAAAGLVGRRPLRRRGVVGVREVSRSRALTRLVRRGSRSSCGCMEITWYIGRCAGWRSRWCLPDRARGNQASSIAVRPRTRVPAMVVPFRRRGRVV